MLVRRIPIVLTPWIRPSSDSSSFQALNSGKKPTSEELLTSSHVNLSLVKKLLVEIYEEDLDDVFQRQSLLNSKPSLSTLGDQQLQKQEEGATLTAVSSNLSDDSFFRRQSVIAEHQVQLEIDKLSTPMQTHNEEEEDELIVLPKNTAQQASQSTLNFSTSQASLRSRAETMAENAVDIDLKTFCMLCDRLMLLLEQ